MYLEYSLLHLTHEFLELQKNLKDIIVFISEKLMLNLYYEIQLIQVLQPYLRYHQINNSVAFFDLQLQHIRVLLILKIKY